MNLPLQEQHFQILLLSLVAAEVMIKTPAWKMENWMEIAVLKREE